MDGSQARNTLPFLRRSFLLGCAQNSTQPLPNHDFFSGLDGHGNEFDVVGLLAFFWVRLTFANRGHQTRIVRPEHLDHWISATQFLHAVEHTVSPGRLIPIDPQRWIAIAILGNEYVGSHARHSFHQLPDAIHAPIPFGIELVLIQTDPGLERREATDHFFLSDFHRPAHGSLPRTGIQQRRLDQILSAEKQTAALWSAQSLAAREAVAINSHPRVELVVIYARDAGGVIQLHCNLMVLRIHPSTLEIFAETDGVV